MTEQYAYIKRQFFNSLKRGTGEAYLILNDNPNIDFSDIIIEGAFTNFAFDQQCEGSRAVYVYRLIKKIPQKDKIIKTVLTKLQVKRNDYWGLDQMCDLAVLFFKAGYPEAKTALYNRFEKNALEGYEFCGQVQLMEIDGINGALKVAESVGKKIFEENDWEDSWHIDNFQKKNKQLSVYNELQKAGKQNKFIDAYLKSIIENKWSRAKYKKSTKFSYELIREKIDANKFRVISVDKANDLSIQEVEKLATEVLEEKDKQRQELYLRFFAKRKFPFDYRLLLKIASGKNPPKTRLVEYAVDSLTYFSGKDIRNLALQKFSSLKNPSNYLNLLVSNYEKGDHQLLVEIANRSDNYEYIHSIAFGFIDIYKVNKTEDCKEPLEIIYNKINCGIHREDIVKLLIDNNVLSDKIKWEIKFDSNIKLRKLHTQVTKNGR
ncbi:hypothetical protein [Parasediminibacterium sp. JCM 36343]|uniref:hypothetical protein n=1 Tax=Parasediminibacterium sp. JCM 36343 TaxID=3374279 RepID=UPI00397DBBAA